MDGLLLDRMRDSRVTGSVRPWRPDRILNGS
jgi:hypothetical protein